MAIPEAAEASSQHVDVLIVGAGISGIGTAYFLKDQCPEKTFALIEGRQDIGGTWDLFKYPGIRSDSDMHTLGFSFKPWKADKAIADGPAIKAYLEETVEENDLRQHIRFQHHVISASWSSETSTWTVQMKRKDTGEDLSYTCNFLSMCSGYYSYKKGFTPDFPGRDRFTGQVIHPQHWPEDLDYSGKKVVVIGSGATAMTLVPAMADKVEHITMLQRSPTYVVSRPDTDVVANTLRKILPDGLAYNLTRWKNIRMGQYIYKQTRTNPEKVAKKLLKPLHKEIGDVCDVDKHFTPTYNPWDQRLCLIPNNDLFEALKSGKASVTTDHIESFTENGIQLKSGETLEADIIVSATGLNMVVLGNIEFSVDGSRIDFSKTWTYKGLAYSDVPNMVSSFGYINASWTLRADLTAEYVCRLINHMDETGTRQCTPRLRSQDLNMPERPWIDDFSAGYMEREMAKFPRQGDRAPWLNPQNYDVDKKMFREGKINDGCMIFGSSEAALSIDQTSHPEAELTAAVG